MENKPSVIETKFLVGFSLATIIAMVILACKIVDSQNKALAETQKIDSQLTKRELEMKYSVVLGEVTKFDKEGNKLGIKANLVYPAINDQEYIKQLENCSYKMYQDRSNKILAICVKGETLTNEKFFKPYMLNNQIKPK
jgi:hypothetical protein